MERPRDLVAIVNAIGYGFNVMVLGDRGSGKTTSLNFAARELAGLGRTVVLVAAGRFTRAAEILQTVADELRALGLDDRSLEGVVLHAGVRSFDPRLSLEDAYGALRDVAAQAQVAPLAIVDSPAPTVAFELFGRLRDELWALELQWVSSGLLDEQGVLLAPPADAFFEQVVPLAPFDEHEIERMLQLRTSDESLPTEVQREIARLSEGTPARALALTRQALHAEDPFKELERGSVVEQIDRELGTPAARVADELARNGPAGPSDRELLRRLGWSRPRAYQVFQALNNAGWVEASAERSGEPGRPRQLYRLKGLIS